MIIDSHAHIGDDVVFDEIITEEDLLSVYSEYDVSGAIIQPMITRPYIEEVQNAHDRIFEFLQNNKDRKYWGMISMNPLFRDEDFLKECKRCKNDLGFVGIKIATQAYGVSPAKRNGFRVFEVADELNLPVMIHTGSGMPMSDPVQILPAARNFPKVNIIIAHSGGDLMVMQTVELAKAFDNVFVEPSWCTPIALRGMYSALGASKIMFSSDMPQNLPVELFKYRHMIKDQDDLEQMLSKTCLEVFNLSI
ncbi:MAG: amidohydrolase family protein [Eubacteriales bacterium]|nr:amidohydrolase family protein [Eubacteriales bacterium]